MTDQPLTAVHVLDEPGLYAVTSGSPSVYYVDTRNPATPHYFRAHGNGTSIASHMDNTWHPLLVLHGSKAALVPIPADRANWTLRVGAGHYFETRRTGHPNGDVYWVFSRDCWEITRLSTMPAPDDFTIDEREPLP